MYKPQEGTWTLTAPDGRQWTGTSGLRAAAAEQRERIPATVQLERLAEACELTEDEKDATRYRWLRDVGQATVEVFFATNNASGWGCWDSWEDKDAGIDAAMLKTPNVKVTGAAQHGKD